MYFQQFIYIYIIKDKLQIKIDLFLSKELNLGWLFDTGL